MKRSYILDATGTAIGFVELDLDKVPGYKQTLSKIVPHIDNEIVFFNQGYTVANYDLSVKQIGVKTVLPVLNGRTFVQIEQIESLISPGDWFEIVSKKYFIIAVNQQNLEFTPGIDFYLPLGTTILLNICQ